MANFAEQQSTATTTGLAVAAGGTAGVVLIASGADMTPAPAKEFARTLTKYAVAAVSPLAPQDVTFAGNNTSVPRDAADVETNTS